MPATFKRTGPTHHLITAATLLLMLCLLPVVSVCADNEQGENDRARPTEKREVDWDSIKARIEGAVERGDMTREEADAKYVEIKQRLANGETLGLKKLTRKDLEALRAKLQQKVEAGEITEEQMAAQLDAMRRKIAQQNQRAEWVVIKKRIEGAVKRGDMTREEADAEYAEIKQRIAAREKRSEQGESGERAEHSEAGDDGVIAAVRKQLDEAGRQLRAAVAAGQITEEQARAKMEHIQKEAAKILKAYQEEGGDDGDEDGEGEEESEHEDDEDGYEKEGDDGDDD